MSPVDLYREGARLPEQLSRLLFLEPVVAGMRVLEVGAQSDAVARFLLDLGATRVVCASTDKALIERLRLDNTLATVDHRVIRPGVLPGDDGAFDLVIDFSLPEALAAGETFRLTDIARLLSRDGFAVTAVPGVDTPTLGALFGETHVQQATSVRSSAGMQHGATVGYRGVLDALKLQFELVQVYFQSLLLGYLFGSFDVEPSGDGVSPATGLMGDQPEPAGHYVFAFGNAIPVMQDVALVQVPFSALLGTLKARNITAPTSLGPPAPSAFTAPAASGVAPDDAGPIAIVALVDAAAAVLLTVEAAGDDNDVSGDDAVARDAYAYEIDARDTLLQEQDAQLQALRANHADVVRRAEQAALALEQTSAHRDELSAFVQGLEASVQAHAAQADDAQQQLRTLRATAQQAETETSAQAQRECDALAQRVHALTVELVELTATIATMGDNRDAAVVRASALESALASTDLKRAELLSQLATVNAAHQLDVGRLRAQHEFVEHTAQAHKDELEAQGRALSEAREGAIAARREADLLAQEAQRAAPLNERVVALTDELRHAHQLMRDADARHAEVAQAQTDAHEAAIAVLAARVLELQQQNDAMRASSDDVARTLKQQVQAHDALTQQLADTAHEAEALRQALAREHERSAKLSDEAQRLAQGVKVLAAERDDNRERLSQHDAARIAQEQEQRQQHDAMAQQLAAQTASVASVQHDLEQKDKRLKAAHAALEEARRELVQAREGLTDVAGQRDTLQQVLRARERELEGSRSDLVDAASAARTHLEQLDVASKGLLEMRERLAAVDADKAQLTQTLQSLAASNHDAHAAALDQSAKLAEAERGIAAAQDAGVSSLARIEQLEAQASAQIAELDSAAREAATASTHHAHALQQWQTASAELNAAHQQHTHANEQHAQQHQRMAQELADKTTALLAQHDSHDSVVAELQNHHATLIDTLAAQHVSERNATQQRIAELSEEAAQSEHRIATLVTEAHVLVQQHKRVLDEVESVQGQLLERDQRAQRLEGSLADTHAALDLQLSRTELLDATLQEARDALAQRTATAELCAASLAEARSLLAVERARGDLFAQELIEAQDANVQSSAERELAKATLAEAQAHAVTLQSVAERDIAAITQAAHHALKIVLHHSAGAREELQAASDANVAALARAELAQAQLAEAQTAAAQQGTQAALRAAEIDDARVTHARRIAALQAQLEAERIHAAAQHMDLQRSGDERAALAIERHGELTARLSEESSNLMLTTAQVEQHLALLENAQRERDAVLGDLTAHQARANAEAQRRQAVEEDLAVVRVTHNQTMAELQRLKLDAEVGRRAVVPELEAELTQLRERLDELASAAEAREQKVAEQADLITRLKDRLVRIQDRP